MSQYAIAVGYDGSDESECALDWALRRAQALDCTVNLLTVVDSSVVNKCGVDAQTFVESVEQQQAQMCAEYASAFPLVTLEPLVKVGKFTKTLQEVGSTFDLLVLGKADNNITSVLTGSPAVQFSASSSTPCVVIPQGWNSGEHEQAKNVVVGVGPDVDVSGAAIMFAAGEAAAQGGQLYLVSSWGLPSWLEKTADAMGGGVSPAGEERARELTVIASQLHQRYPDLLVQCHCVEGSSTTNTLRALSANASLLVLGTNARSMVGRALYGSPTYETLLNPRVPVVVVPPEYGVRTKTYLPGDLKMPSDDVDVSLLVGVAMPSA